MPGERGEPREIAPGIHWLSVGAGVMRANVYFIRSGGVWALIDAGSAGCAGPIRSAAESLFGPGAPPAAILLTHDHPDHAGAVRDLVMTWGCPAWVHPDELPLTVGDISAVRLYGSPLDRRVVLPLMRLMGSRRAQAMVARSSLKEVVRPLASEGDTLGAGPAETGALGTRVPGLQDWEAVHTPGHAPGHVAYFRSEDRVLISGDAVVTLDLNSIVSLVRKRPVVSGPPWYATWNRRKACASVGLLAGLEPTLIAGGHGIPVAGPAAALGLRALAERLAPGAGA